MKKLLISSLLLVLSPLFLVAQVSNNTALVGTVTDTTGAAVVGAEVTGTNRDTKVTYPGTTNDSGYYSIPFILPGIYDVTVARPTFVKVVVTGVVVVLNTATRTNATLSIGSTAAEITVSADTPALSTDDALLGETLGVTKVENLPMNTRRVMELAATSSNIIRGCPR